MNLPCLQIVSNFTFPDITYQLYEEDIKPLNLYTPFAIPVNSHIKITYPFFIYYWYS